MILNTEKITQDIYEKGLAMAERVFDTPAHPDQMQATPENFNKLKSINPNTILYEVREGRPVAWVVLVPTTIEVMDKFLKGEISEQKLLDLTQPQEKYPALYLCAAATLPEYQRQGIAGELTKTAISRMPLENNYIVYSWPTSKAGEVALKKFEAETGKVIQIKHEQVRSS